MVGDGGGGDASVWWCPRTKCGISNKLRENKNVGDVCVCVAPISKRDTVPFLNSIEWAVAHPFSIHYAISHVACIVEVC